jgi:gas vesicle protein
MDKASAGMRSLCEDILRSREKRRIDIRRLKEQAQAIRENARKFLADSMKFQEEMNKKLRENLQDGKRGLMKDVGTFLEDFEKRKRELRADLAEASRIWNKTREAFRNSKGKPR